MANNFGHIKNPLTIIAIFASIAEVSGTVILPFVAPEDQTLFIWFLMIFPIFLVSVFFLTLNFNHRVLYAPSDYKDESNFMSSLANFSPEEQRRSIQRELDEIEAGSNSDIIDTDEGSKRNINEAYSSSRRVELLAELSLAEKLAIYKLSSELNLNFRSDIGINLAESNIPAQFDALAFTDGELHAVEVKLLKSHHIQPARFHSSIEKAEKVSQVYQGIMYKTVILHIFVVLDSQLDNEKELYQLLEDCAANSSVTVKFYITTLDDLRNNYMHSP